MVQLKLYRFAGRGEFREERRDSCPVCGGDFKKCRLETCPYLKDVRELLRKVQGSRIVFGSSPPSAFIGSWGYPRVLAGPLVPPIQADTSLMEDYGSWLDLPLQKLVSMRVSMVRGKKPVKIEDARNPSRLLTTIQELGMAYTPTDVELELDKEPVIRPGFKLRYAPTGPSGTVVKAILAENPTVPRVVDRIVSDIDLRASQAIYKLYRSGIGEQHIVRLFSLGLLGLKRWRRLVPTEWSITAVDDQIGRWLRSRLKEYDWINMYEIYQYEAHYNRVTVLLIPGPWMFEVFEVWYRGGSMKIYHDSELPGDPDRYPENVGGAYHALRLPILEKLSEIRRQASALAIAEIYEGWIPLGVWRFREICRRAMKFRRFKSNSLEETLVELGKAIDLPLRVLDESRVLRYHKEQKRLTEFLKLF